MNLIKIINLIKCLNLIIFFQIICIHGFPKNTAASKEIHDYKNKSSINMGNNFLSNTKITDTSVIQKKLMVKINRRLKSFERVAASGNIDEMGNWKLNNAKLLNKIEFNDKYEIWGGILKTPINETFTIRYRYFVATVDESQIHVEDWETNIQHRVAEDEDILDEYGVINNTYNIDRGWLTGKSIVQLKFYRNPFNCDRIKDRKNVAIKIIPISDSLNKIEDFGFERIQNEEAKIEVTKFKYNESQLVYPSEEGEVYRKNDIIIYHITVKNLQKIGYVVYLSTMDHSDMKIPLGYQVIMPSELKGSEGVLDIPIISQTELKPIGFMKIRYLIIKPYLKAKQLNLRTTFAQYWEPTWNKLDIGHRGLGSSFKYYPKHQPPAIENTIAGFKKSVKSGADAIEFDVHLTKDLIPIIYHDFYVNVCFQSGLPTKITQLIKIPLYDLTYDQLKDLTTYHVVNKISIFEYPSHNEEKEIDKRLFPTLQDVFEKVDKSVGLNIEIKWPQRLSNGNNEANQNIDKNIFVNKILSTLLEKGCGRFVYMSSFDADICTMIKFKQNLFPIMFLILGDSEYYEDPRCNSMEAAVCNVQAFNMLGVVGFTGNYFSDSTQVKLGTNLNQIVLTWGSHANSAFNINKLRSTGLHGVIYDRLDLFCEKNKSIFNTDHYRKLFEQQCLTIE